MRRVRRRPGENSMVRRVGHVEGTLSLHVGGGKRGGIAANGFVFWMACRYPEKKEWKARKEIYNGTDKKKKVRRGTAHRDFYQKRASR